MGICSSSQKLTPEQSKQKREAEIRSKWIDEQLNTDSGTDKESIKLLFLGAGESGKSTMLKQMKIIHQNSFSQEDRKNFVDLIHSNVIQSMKTLCKQHTLLLVEKDRHKDRSYVPQQPVTEAYKQLLAGVVPLQPQNEKHKDLINSLRYDDKVQAGHVAGYIALWSDPGIQQTFKMKSFFQLSDSTEYFMSGGRLEEIVKPGYLPTDQDILRARIRTTGIVEHKVHIEGNDFRMYDVGGQRNARKKWIHCFENVTSVIFVAALSGYDQVLYEDNKTNNMHEALNLFEDILASSWFKDMSIILFLNKKDIFREKIRTVPLTVCFPDYPGPMDDYAAGCRYIKQMFKDRNKNAARKIYTHYTNATDTNNFKKVFASVQAIILRLHLVDVGLLDMDTELNQPGEEEADEFDLQDYEQKS